MGAFLGAIGSAALQDAKQKAMRSPIGQAIQGGMNRYRQGQNPAGPQIPSQETADDAGADGYSMPTPMPTPDPMAHGRIVTKPTVALLGEHGSEMVVPMNADPNNKVSMPPVPGMRLPSPPHPRYRR